MNRVAVGTHRTGLAVWFAAFAGPLAWVTHLLVGYSAEEVACARANAERGHLFGADVQLVILVLGIATAALAAAGAVTGAIVWRTRDDRGIGPRRAFMASTGVFTGLLFLGLIAFGTIQIGWFGSCS